MANIPSPAPFTLHSQLATDTLAAGQLGISILRLMNDQRFFWLVMVPARPGLVEIFDLPEQEQQTLMAEIATLSCALKTITSCDKINIAAFGNMVPQLHIHVIARFKTDLAWPASAIGLAGAEAYSPSAAAAFIGRLTTQLTC